MLGKSREEEMWLTLNDSHQRPEYEKKKKKKILSVRGEDVDVSTCARNKKRSQADTFPFKSSAFKVSHTHTHTLESNSRLMRLMRRCGAPVAKVSPAVSRQESDKLK